MWILSLIIIIFLIALYPSYRRYLTIKKWSISLSLDKHHRNHNRLFEATNGFLLSRQAREKQDALEYTYGEIEFISFIALLSLTKPDESTVFYDFGSGVGKAVFACSMVFNVKKSCGIELFSDLHHRALTIREQLYQLSDYNQRLRSLVFINANFLDSSFNFQDATLIFINSTAFFGENWLLLNQRLASLKSGTIVITTSKKLVSDVFYTTKITTVQMSWGPVRAYIQQRIK